MAKDDVAIPSWQKAASEDRKDSETQSDQNSQPSSENLPSFEFREVKEMPPVPTREEAAKFLEHPGTKDATLDDKIAFLELKGVQRTDIEALVPEAKKYYAAVSPIACSAMHRV
jgi:Pex14 N-terminal domain